MADGNVTWFNADKDGGFVERGDNLFVHISEIQGDGVKDLAERQAVSCTDATGHRERPRRRR
jgi:cold shock CspA family protein